jgi:hypothetical protein
VVSRAGFPLAFNASLEFASLIRYTLDRMDEHFDIIYINEVFNREEWHTFEVGNTRFSDQALAEAGKLPPEQFPSLAGFQPINPLCSLGEMAIFHMRAKRPAYNLLDNNCQNFALNFLDKIQIGKHRDFATSFSVYQRAIGAGTIKDLFVDELPDDKPGTTSEDMALGANHHNPVQTAQQVM